MINRGRQWRVLLIFKMTTDQIKIIQTLVSFKLIENEVQQLFSYLIWMYVIMKSNQNYEMIKNTSCW